MPASQIECERVFSEAGLISRGLRNRLSPEGMDDLIFISRNANVRGLISTAISSVYGTEFANKFMNFELQWKSEVVLIEDELVDVVDEKNDLHISAVERMLDSVNLVDDDGIDDDDDDDDV